MRQFAHPTAVFAFLLSAVSFARAAPPSNGPTLPEPGPENGGLRSRLVVVPNLEAAKGGKDGYDVRLDLLNVTDHPIVLRANWRHQIDDGNLRDYLEASTSIETYPPIAPWIGQVMGPTRKSPQPEYTLKPGEVLTVSWRTDHQRLKNRVVDPNTVQNPEFPAPGLYAVHAATVVHIPDAADSGERTVQLRSNEQMVSVGGSREMPRHTVGQLVSVDPAAQTAAIGLGSLHKVAPGDVFRIRTGMLDHWRLTITSVDPAWATGRLHPEPLPPESSRTTPTPPERGTSATLVPQK
jgi:hypothetical protein